MFGSRRRFGRRTSLSPSRRRESTRTPDLLYLALIVMCAAGVWFTRDTNVRTLTGHVINAYNDEPIDGATITLHGDPKALKQSGLPEEAKTDSAAGYYKFGDVPTALTIAADADGFVASTPAALNLRPSGKDGMTYDIRLVPTTVRGVIRDAVGKPMSNTVVTLSVAGKDPRSIVTKEDGAYTFADVPQIAQIVVKATGYRRAAFTLNKVYRRDITLEPFQAKGVYVNAYTASDDEDFDKTIAMMDKSEINTAVIEIKNFIGNVYYGSSVPGTRPIAADKGLIKDVGARLKTLHEHGIYTIARIVVFQDSVLAATHPDWAIKSKRGGAWYDDGKNGWMNPYKKEVWDYNLAIATEVVAAGFDEVQFDAVQFPPSGDLTDTDYGQQSNADTRVATLHDFLQQAKDRFAPQGVFVSAALYGLTTIDGGDLSIGQNLKKLAPAVDYLSPVLYPVQWGTGTFNIERPAEKPGEIVQQSLSLARASLAGTQTRLRPWLQDFSFDKQVPKYGEKEVRAQIDAVGKGVSPDTGWMLWNANSTYTEAALKSGSTKAPLISTTDTPPTVNKDTQPGTPAPSALTTSAPTVTANITP